MKLHSTTHGTSRHPDRLTEDAFNVVVRDGRVIAALADGVGSSREGRAAAQRAVAMIADYYLARPQAWTPRRALNDFANQINRIFHQESQLRHSSAELLCTLSVVVIEGGRLYGLNVGDSPVFLWRRDALTLLSQSHAVAQSGMEHVLTRAVGLETTVEPFFFENTIEDNDLVLLCSDGVTNAVPREALAPLLARRATARTIVTAANEVTEASPELRDDASAIVLDIAQRGWAASERDRPLEVIPTLRAGETIDDFKLLKPLQEGARVWLASHISGNQHVLKFPPLEARDDEARRDGFIRELWQATRIESPDFLRATVPGEGTLRYYVTDYLDAPTLRTVLAKAPLRVEDAVALGRFLLRACQFLLSRDHAHGDLKPDNILVIRDSADLRFKLIDLGSTAEIFSVNTRAGTPSYLAPERFQGAALSERTELFAIGVTLYEALTRAYPYGEIERFQTPRFETAPKRLSRLNSAVPAWLETVILRALAPDPRDRYQNFSEMTYAFDHPDEVTPFYRKDAPLLERNPLLFFKVLCLVLFLANVYLLVRLSLH